MAAQILRTGFADITVTTAEESLDLTTKKNAGYWVYCEAQDVYLAWCVDGSTPATMDTDAASLNTEAVPMRINVGQVFHLKVPADRPMLRYRSVTGTGGVLRLVEAPE